MCSLLKLRSALALSAWLLCVGQLLAQPTAKTNTQQTPATNSATTEATGAENLTDGLLDLLKSPSAGDGAGQGARKSAALPGSPLPLQPSDVGLEGEDLGEQSDNPLAAVRQSMLIAAGFLQSGERGSDTRILQRDIVSRLDDLIAELEKPSSNLKQQPKDGQSQASQSQQQTRVQQPQKQTAEGDEQSQSAGSEPSDGQSGNGEMAGGQNVQLADPEALQKSVWGQLPERVRKQMQSRMVEKFLPSYRQQIEAYFQALLNEQ